MSNPKITVITSCFNAEKYLHEAIESILSQSFKDFEYILIDDGSQDTTLDIIKKYSAIDKRIVVVKKNNTGLTDSLNMGLKTAKSKWIARMDADDISMPDRLMEQYKYVTSRDNVVLLGSGCVQIDEQGDVISLNQYPSHGHGLLNRLIKMKAFFPHSSSFYKLETALDLGMYRERLNGAEDYDMWLRMSRKGEIACLPSPLIRLRKHTESITGSNVKYLTYAYLALTSYFIVNSGYTDPVAQDEKKYMGFKTWVATKIEKKDFFKMFSEWMKIKNAWLMRGNTNQFLLIINLVLKIALSNTGRKIIAYKILGDTIAKELATEWMENNGSLRAD